MHMEMIRFFDLMLVLFILLLPSEMLMQVGADECEYRSAHFKGPCFQRDKECYDCCQEEGFDRGSCKGFLLRRCICSKSCESPGYEPPPPPPEEDVPPPENEAPIN
ncbi:hypothetical protein ACLB2K_025520 [Fragaria x ananassa]